MKSKFWRTSYGFHNKLESNQKNVEAHLKSGDLELVVLPKVEYDALLEKLDDLKDIHDSAEALKEYR